MRGIALALDIGRALIYRHHLKTIPRLAYWNSPAVQPLIRKAVRKLTPEKLGSMAFVAPRDLVASVPHQLRGKELLRWIAVKLIIKETIDDIRLEDEERDRMMEKTLGPLLDQLPW